jgi:hypothetical protein
MDNPEALETLGTQGTGRRQEKKPTHITQKTQKLPTKTGGERR